MSSRADTMNGWSEQFCYDGLNRLTVAALNGLCNQPAAKKFFYDALGNLTEKSDVCNTVNCYVYGGAAPHALTSVAGTYGGITNPTFDYDANGNMTCEHTGAHCNMGTTVQAVTYTPFNMAATVATGGATMGLDYRADHARYKMCVPGCSGTPTSTTFYLYDPATGGMSEKLVSGGSTTWTDYVLSPEGHIVATRTKAGSTITWLYTVVDNLGSTVSMTNGPAIGPATVIERDSYDAWGKRRNPLTGADVACGSITSATTRGYTGHEMLDSQCLINMNARLYDPTLARFQSADSMVPDPFGTQSYNRYSYVENNPLNTIDPTGHESDGGGSGQDGGSEECGKSGEMVCNTANPEVGGGQYGVDDTTKVVEHPYGYYHPCYSCSTAGIPLNLLQRWAFKVDVGGHVKVVVGTVNHLLHVLPDMWDEAAAAVPAISDPVLLDAPLPNGATVVDTNGGCNEYCGGMQPTYIGGPIQLYRLRSLLAEQWEADRWRGLGARVVPYVWFRDPKTGLASNLDMVTYLKINTPAGTFQAWNIVEVKTGNAQLTINQAAVDQALRNGTAIPFGPNSAAAGLIPNEPIGPQTGPLAVTVSRY